MHKQPQIGELFWIYFYEVAVTNSNIYIYTYCTMAFFSSCKNWGPRSSVVKDSGATLLYVLLVMRFNG